VGKFPLINDFAFPLEEMHNNNTQHFLENTIHNAQCLIKSQYIINLLNFAYFATGKPTTTTTTTTTMKRNQHNPQKGSRPVGELPDMRAKQGLPQSVALRRLSDKEDADIDKLLLGTEASQTSSKPHKLPKHVRASPSAEEPSPVWEDEQAPTTPKKRSKHRDSPPAVVQEAPSEDREPPIPPKVTPKKRDHADVRSTTPVDSPMKKPLKEVRLEPPTNRGVKKVTMSDDFFSGYTAPKTMPTATSQAEGDTQKVLLNFSRLEQTSDTKSDDKFRKRTGVVVAGLLLFAFERKVQKKEATHATYAGPHEAQIVCTGSLADKQHNTMRVSFVVACERTQALSQFLQAAQGQVVIFTDANLNTVDAQYASTSFSITKKSLAPNADTDVKILTNHGEWTFPEPIHEHKTFMNATFFPHMIVLIMDIAEQPKFYVVNMTTAFGALSLKLWKNNDFSGALELPSWFNGVKPRQMYHLWNVGWDNKWSEITMGSHKTAFTPVHDDEPSICDEWFAFKHEAALGNGTSKFDLDAFGEELPQPQ
jgi:hypothetical protein